MFVYNLRYPGQYFDSETGLNYNIARDVDPQTGRYVESDPVGLDGGLGTYTYVSGNPVSLADPLGLFTYNKPPPSTVPVPPAMVAKVSCLEKCVGTPLVATRGMEKNKPTGGLCHSPNSLHYSGHAVDLGFNGNPTIQSAIDAVLCCARQCNVKYGGIEGAPKYPPQIHLQDVPGNGYDQQIPEGTCSFRK